MGQINNEFLQMFCVSNFVLIIFFLKYINCTHGTVLGKASKTILKKDIFNHQKKVDSQFPEKW